MNDFQIRLVTSMGDTQISASELSKATGIDKSAISNYVNGVYVPKQDKVYKMARVLGVDAGWLMTGDEPISAEQQARNQFDNILINAYHVADEGTQAAVCKLLDIRR